jgi:hypothetical protein
MVVDAPRIAKARKPGQFDPGIVEIRGFTLKMGGGRGGGGGGGGPGPRPPIFAQQS